MKKFLLPLFLFLLPVGLFAQSTPTVPIQKFTLSGKVSALSVNGTPLLDTDAVVQVGISTNFSLRQDNHLIALPTTSTTTTASAGTIGQIYLGGVEYRLAPLNNALANTFLSQKNGFSTYAFGQLGIARSAANQTLAESVGGGLNWCAPANPTCVNIAEVAWIHGSIPNGVNASTGAPTYGNNAFRISVGISF